MPPAQENDGLNSGNRSPRVEKDWIVSHKKRFRANIIVWGLSRNLSTVEIRAKFSDLGLASFVAGGRETMLG